MGELTSKRGGRVLRCTITLKAFMLTKREGSVIKMNTVFLWAFEGIHTCGVCRPEAERPYI